MTDDEDTWPYIFKECGKSFWIFGDIVEGKFNERNVQSKKSNDLSCPHDEYVWKSKTTEVGWTSNDNIQVDCAALTETQQEIRRASRFFTNAVQQKLTTITEELEKIKTATIEISNPPTNPMYDNFTAEETNDSGKENDTAVKTFSFEDVVLTPKGSFGLIHVNSTYRKGKPQDQGVNVTVIMDHKN